MNKLFFFQGGSRKNNSEMTYQSSRGSALCFLTHLHMILPCEDWNCLGQQCLIPRGLPSQTDADRKSVGTKLRQRKILLGQNRVRG